MISYSWIHLVYHTQSSWSGCFLSFTASDTAGTLTIRRDFYSKSIISFAMSIEMLLISVFPRRTNLWSTRATMSAHRSIDGRGGNWLLGFSARDWTIYNYDIIGINSHCPLQDNTLLDKFSWLLSDTLTFWV